MKIYSDKLTKNDLYETVQKIPGMFIHDITEINAKIRQNGWEVVTAGQSNRWKNSGTTGAQRLKAATYDDHGQWFSILFEIDPNAKIIRYNGAQDFHRKTNNRYKMTLVDTI